MKDFQQNKEALNRELNKFHTILDELLPRYSLLLEKQNITNTELAELGELEHYLIEVNAKISVIKKMLDKDLFGQSLDTYYKLKLKAEKGDLGAVSKLERIKTSFEKSMKNGSIFNWN